MTFGFVVAALGLLVSPWIAMFGVLLVVAAPLALLLPALRHRPKHRYDAIGDDLAAMIGTSRETRVRRPRDPDR